MCAFMHACVRACMCVTEHHCVTVCVSQQLAMHYIMYLYTDWLNCFATHGEYWQLICDQLTMKSTIYNLQTVLWAPRHSHWQWTCTQPWNSYTHYMLQLDCNCAVKLLAKSNLSLPYRVTVSVSNTTACQHQWSEKSSTQHWNVCDTPPANEITCHGWLTNSTGPVQRSNGS